MDNRIPNMDYDADEVINEFKEKIKWPKSDEVTAIVKPSKMPLRVFISLIITAIAGGVAYYMMLPAFNIKDTQMYLFLLLLVVVLWLHSPLCAELTRKLKEKNMLRKNH